MKQLPLPPPRTWGGRREGAGRKPGLRPRVRHRPRPAHAASYPLHVTLRRVRDGVPSLRMGRRFEAIEEAIRKSTSAAFRIVHFSVQRDHVHLIVEAHDRFALTRGMRGLAIRAALAVDRSLGRRGRVWDDRYHARELRTPREVRSAIAYVLLNRRKHDARAAHGVDPCSSGAWFNGWCERQPLSEDSPVTAARTWLLSVGWRRIGLIRVDERPGSQPRRLRRPARASARNIAGTSTAPTGARAPIRQPQPA
jgi:REP element-mobilizing transposase RayT